MKTFYFIATVQTNKGGVEFKNSLSTVSGGEGKARCYASAYRYALSYIDDNETIESIALKFI